MVNPHGNNPYGRPKNSRNRLGHVAGGAGRGQGRKSNEAIRLAAIEKEKKDAEKKKRDLQKQQQDRLVAEQRKRELEDQRRRYLEESRRVLAELGASAEECAPAEEDESNDNGALEDEICEQAENEGILNDDSTNRRKYKGYMPPKGSCLYNCMEKIQQQMQ